ncbi:hypothetical protein SAMD00019534_065170 [Acytostelium subglobosum LB1]|uniref:hypothetical protein n=1 Tax=Acytostelium subglobosum LB1 TaxID=1410327 RepID=UPI0006451DC7|nr:hypothetical protein SAMD00019534_065170 [Acytostelium subglobosum LB1]GAM23342.1 hypothetical protein SAMD00019534_065170 [Acytostelium subglobosum LB1]|eukprot:XP_012753791.1 hypothetical protein SAMD00019534_065170 [Acytostelium subglobosum LB1]
MNVTRPGASNFGAQGANNNNINNINNNNTNKQLGILNNDTFLYRINELEEENARLNNRIIELESINGRLKEQLEYFQTKLLEKSLEEDRELSDCLADIYESLTVSPTPQQQQQLQLLQQQQQQHHHHQQQRPGQFHGKPSAAPPPSAMNKINLNNGHGGGHSNPAASISPRPAPPPVTQRKPILIRSTSESLLQQSPDTAESGGTNTAAQQQHQLLQQQQQLLLQQQQQQQQAQLLQQQHDEERSNYYSNNNGSQQQQQQKVKNWSIAAPNPKARSDTVAATPKESFIRLPPQQSSPQNMPANRIAQSNSTSFNQLSSSTPVFTTNNQHNNGSHSSPISLSSSINNTSSSSSLSGSPPNATSSLLKALPPVPAERKTVKMSPVNPGGLPNGGSNNNPLTRSMPTTGAKPSIPLSSGRPSMSSLLGGEDEFAEEPENLDDPNLVLTKSEDGTYLVKGGTLDKLVQRLSYDKSHDTDFASAFLLTYRSFTTPLDLLDMLIRSYNIEEDSHQTLPQAIFEKKCRIVRLRVANVIKKWLDKHFHDFSEDAALVAKLDQFINSQIIVDLEGIGKNLKKLLYNERAAPIPTFTDAAPPVIAPKSRDAPFLELDTTEVARQLTLIESEMYRKIESKECLGQSWNKPNKDELAPNIVAFIRRFNAVSVWVATEIVRTEKLKERVGVVKRFIIIAQKCREMGNFNGCMEILSGLQNSAVYRLSKTWEKIESKPLIKNVYDELIVLMAQKNNFKDYRAALHSVHPPCIPYLGVYLTDLTFIEDGTKNMLNNRDDLINFEKRRKISVVIREIKQYQQTPYHFRVEETTQRYVKNIPGLTEKALYKSSQLCEPKEQRSSSVESVGGGGSSGSSNSSSSLKKEFSISSIMNVLKQ